MIKRFGPTIPAILGFILVIDEGRFTPYTNLCGTALIWVSFWLMWKFDK